MTEEKAKTVMDEDDYEAFQQQLLDKFEERQQQKSGQIDGRWVEETKNGNGLLIQRNGVTEVLYYDTIDRIRNAEEENGKYGKTVLYEQDYSSNKEEEEKED